VRLWYGRNVSGTFQLIRYLRANADDMAITVIGTYPRPDHVMLQACDEAAVEPVVPAEDYVDWAVEFAEKHRVDVFVPGEARQLAVALAAERFAAVGTLVQASAPDVIAVLQDKAETYRLAREIGIQVPAYVVAHSGTELREAYASLQQAGHAVTVKPVKGFGGAGFWKLSDEPPDLETLLGLPDVWMHIDDAVAILDRAEQGIPPLLVSQYVSSPEDSVDVLAAGGATLASVIRRKPSLGQTKSFPLDPELTELTERVIEHFRPEYLCNVQWRRDEGRPVLLEVNTRAASGLFQSCATGVNFPYLALRLCLGLDITVPPILPSPDQVSFTDAVVMHPLTVPSVDGRT